MRASTFWSLLINPFRRIAGWKAFFIGLGIMLITTFVGYLGSTVPIGLLSIRPMEGVSLANVFFCQVSFLALLVVITYLAALITTKHVRFQDVLGIMTLAQAPVLLLVGIGPLIKPTIDTVLGLTKNVSSDLSQLQSISAYLFLTIIGIVMVAILVWYIALLYNGFRTLTDIKGTKGVVIFIFIVFVLCNLLSLPLILLLTNGAVVLS